jgi:hypothetical protein
MGSGGWFWSAEQRLTFDRGREREKERRWTEQRKESCEEKRGTE